MLLHVSSCGFGSYKLWADSSVPYPEMSSKGKGSTLGIGPNDIKDTENSCNDPKQRRENMLIEWINRNEKMQRSWFCMKR